MSTRTEPQKCSYMDSANNMTECPKEARWACRVNFGPFMLGWWGCDDHKPYFESLLPVIDMIGGAHQAVPVLGTATRSPLILHLDYLATGQTAQFKCDICDRPVVRNFEQQMWNHVDPMQTDHEARVG